MYGNLLDELPNEKAKKSFFRGYLEVNSPECPTGIHPGELMCYRIACHAPEMIPFMPHIVQQRLRNYGSHLDRCDYCMPFFATIEMTSPMHFKSSGIQVQ